MVSKLVNLEGNQMVANGNYFETQLVDEEVAYSILLAENERVNLNKVKIRRWTLGEIVTSIVDSGLSIKSLEEEAGARWVLPSESPENIEYKIPSLYTLIAVR
jgi:hypothetical protein